MISNMKRKVKTNKVEIQNFISCGWNMSFIMALCALLDWHCPCSAQISRDKSKWINHENYVLGPGNTRMFTGPKIGRIVFISWKFEKIFVHANAIDRDTCQCTTKRTFHKFLACRSISFYKKDSQAAACQTKSQMLRIERNQCMTSCTRRHGGLPNKVNYWPPDMIDQKTLEEICVNVYVCMNLFQA